MKMKLCVEGLYYLLKHYYLLNILNIEENLIFQRKNIVHCNRFKWCGRRVEVTFLVSRVTGEGGGAGGVGAVPHTMVCSAVLNTNSPLLYSLTLIIFEVWPTIGSLPPLFSHMSLSQSEQVEGAVLAVPVSAMLVKT